MHVIEVVFETRSSCDTNGPGARFSRAPKRFRTLKATVTLKSRTLWQQSFPFIQEVSGPYAFPYLDTNKLVSTETTQVFFGVIIFLRETYFFFVPPASCSRSQPRKDFSYVFLCPGK